MSGTLSGDKFTDRAFLSKASLSILFLVAEPQSLYKPVARNKGMVFIAHIQERFRFETFFITRLILTDNVKSSSLHFFDATPYDNRNIRGCHR